MKSGVAKQPLDTKTHALKGMPFSGEPVMLFWLVIGLTIVTLPRAPESSEAFPIILNTSIIGAQNTPAACGCPALLEWKNQKNTGENVTLALPQFGTELTPYC